MALRRRILVIDDEESVRDVICESLQDCGYEVFAASDGERGIALIDSANPPDAVITDIIMPRKEGLETIMEIRRKHPSIKLIAISGGGRSRTTDFLELAQKLGADAVMPKPIDMEDLEQTLKKLIGQ